MKPTPLDMPCRAAGMLLHDAHGARSRRAHSPAAQQGAATEAVAPATLAYVWTKRMPDRRPGPR